MRPLLSTTVLLLLAIPQALAEDREIFRSTTNPDPDVLPTLGVWQEHARKKDRYYTYISAGFPNVPGFVCDMWCYESGGIHYQSARELEGGIVQLRHAWDDHDWEIVTTATPLKGAVEVVARLEPTKNEASCAAEEYPSLNICWQLERAQGFSSEKNFYPEFVQRCFIFTQRGRIFLHNTRRRPIPVRPLTDKENNPPWVQMYVPKSAPADMQASSQSWADYSPDRYLYPVIGTASRDGKYLTAMAAGAEQTLSQAWHDCMHNNPGWLTAADGKSKEWRVRIYVMENDPDALIRRFQRDFPKVTSWEGN